MRILMLEPTARDQHASVDQRLDHCVVGVALIALLGDDPLRLAAGVARSEAWRLVGEEAVAVDRIRDGGVDAACFESASVGGPNIEVIAAMAGRGVHKAGARVVGYVLAVEERDGETISLVEISKIGR